MHRITGEGAAAGAQPVPIKVRGSIPTAPLPHGHSSVDLLLCRDCGCAEVPLGIAFLYGPSPVGGLLGCGYLTVAAELGWPLNAFERLAPGTDPGR